jgi:uncharacterized membrane protein
MDKDDFVEYSNGKLTRVTMLTGKATILNKWMRSIGSRLRRVVRFLLGLSVWY